MSLGRLFGIEIRIDFSWLFVFALATWSLSSGAGPFGGAVTSLSARVILGVVTALLFFGSILAHELAHSLVARSRGVPIQRITLFMFGGVSSFEGEPTTAPSAAWIALVGPLTSLAIGVIFALAASFLGSAESVAARIAGYLAFANIAIALFNLLPVFPLDGGRVFHAILWSRFKDRARATRTAVAFGRILASIMIAFGIYETFFLQFGSGLWLTFIGWFLLQAGQAEAFQTEVATALQGHKVGELAESADVRIVPNATAADALELMRGRHVRALPVMLEDQLLGILTLSDFSKVERDRIDSVFVTALMTRLESLKSLAPDTSASQALRLVGESGHQQLPIIDREGKFHGFVTAQAILRWVAFDRDFLLADVMRKR